MSKDRAIRIKHSNGSLLFTDIQLFASLSLSSRALSPSLCKAFCQSDFLSLSLFCLSLAEKVWYCSLLGLAMPQIPIARSTKALGFSRVIGPERKGTRGREFQHNKRDAASARTFSLMLSLILFYESTPHTHIHGQTIFSVIGKITIDDQFCKNISQECVRTIAILLTNSNNCRYFDLSQGTANFI